MGLVLNNAQIQILKIFSLYQSEEDLKELKSLLLAYLANKKEKNANERFDQKYIEEVFNTWKTSYFKKETK